ncbi:hypothetical protein B0H10DRAFT_2215293 [Mycena sp. CBHHK59/15]|nr:hypothetical protein B0H10DRAFT_2215293 [Mycena sp. CBHHK59/15]
MSIIQWLLATLRRLILDNPLLRGSIRGLLFLLSAVSRATKRRRSIAGTDSSDGTGTIRVIFPRDSDCEGGAPAISYPSALRTHASHEDRDTPLPLTHTSTSFVAASLHPYQLSGLSASCSSPQDIGSLPIPQESRSIRSLSVQNLPATLSAQNFPTSLSVQDLPRLPPSPNLGIGTSYIPSANTSVIDFHLAATDSPNPNRSPRSSGVHGDVAIPSAPLLLNEAHPRIFPGIPETVGRYKRKSSVPNEPSRYTIPPLTITLLPDEPPESWTACLHPEGARYFFHEERRVFTDANLFDTELLESITNNVRIIHDFLRAHGIQLSACVDLVVDEYVYSDGSKGCQYYFVNHETRCVFWVDKTESDLFPISAELNGITSKSHIRHELEAQYWYHCELFPRSLEVTHEIVDELRDIVLHAFGDLITSASSTVSWKVEDLNHMLNLTDGFKNVGNKFSGSSCLVGRLMHVFVRARVYNFHGEATARLNIDQSVYDTTPKQTLLMTMLSPLLFYAPDFHLVGLHTIYTDGLIRSRGWADFIQRLNSEWQEFTLYATVVLNANVAFLAIQSVDQGGTSVTNRSPTQISSYLSILTSIGSIIIGLLLVKQNRNRDRETAQSAASFIFNRMGRTLGLETLAVLHSLPYAMLIWSMVSFLAAFSFMCFERSSLVTRMLVGVLWTAVASLILWCIFSAWETGDWDWLRRLACGANPADEEYEAQEEKSQTSDEAPKTKPLKIRWAWPKFTIRKGSYDSERTVTAV